MITRILPQEGNGDNETEAFCSSVLLDLVPLQDQDIQKQHF